MDLIQAIYCDIVEPRWLTARWVDGKFTQSGRKRFVEVPGDAVKSGVLPREAIERVFRGQAATKTISIRFWPLVMARKSSHGSARAGGLPELVAPVVSAEAIEI